MLHLDPSLTDALDTLAAGDVHRIVVVALAPQYSPIILAGYERTVAAWQAEHPDVEVHIAGAWHLMPEWIDALAERAEEALANLPERVRSRIPIIFTAHSLPRAVVDRDPAYITQLRDTAAAVATRLGVDDERWSFAYQSAGHTPEEWLTPDLKDLFPGFRADGITEILVVPLQFLADHLEILYDIDIAAGEEAAAAGITMHRIELPNTQPTFIRALAAVVERERGAQGRSAHPDRVRVIDPVGRLQEHRQPPHGARRAALGIRHPWPPTRCRRDGPSSPRRRHAPRALLR